MNMDYALSHAMSYHTDGIKRVLLLYDINCQYTVHLKKMLYLAPDLILVPGIGLFHVHGHQDKCFMRYSPSFIVFAGLVDGEILETLWALLNKISGSTRGMSDSHRREVLDRHMNDNNWKKMITMSEHRHLTRNTPQTDHRQSDPSAGNTTS